MGQEPNDFLEECTDEPRAVEFPIALLEPPARWTRVEYFDANDLDEIAEEMAYQLGRDEEEMEPEASSADSLSTGAPANSASTFTGAANFWRPASSPLR